MNSSMRMTVLAWLLVLGPVSMLHAENAIWWEGESAIRHDFVEAPWLKTEVTKTQLSRMDWLCCYLARTSPEIKSSYTAEYKVEVGANGTYFFWVREFYRRMASPWRFRFNGGDWVAVANDHLSTDVSDLGKDRSAVWCQYGPFQLKPGPLKVEIELQPQAGKDVVAGFDAFLLIDAPFTPEGWRKPACLSKHEYIGTFAWMEGEEAETDFTSTDKDKALSATHAKLSGGKQLALLKTNGGSATASWKFVVPSSDSYHVWIRQSAYASSSPYRHRFNIAKWREMPTRDKVFDLVGLDPGQEACWVDHGKFFLTEGENTIHLETTGPVPGGTALRLGVDAICLSLEPFFPNGRHRPDVIVKADTEGWFAFQPQGDIFIEAPPELNLRHLNEAVAGKFGSCQVDRKAGLCLGDGRPARFWGVNAYRILQLGRDEVTYFVERMARAGVNLIRLRGPLNPPEDRTFGAWDRDLLDRVHFLVGACRQQGIYVALAPFAPADYEVDRQQGFAGYENAASKAPFGLLFINPEFQRRYREWTSFLAVPNPYSGKRTLGEDPAVAWIEIQNGDSLLGANLGQMPKEQRQLLEVSYNRWLTDRYGSETNVLRTWSIPGRYHPVIPEDGSKDSRCFRMLPPDWFLPTAINRQDQAQFRHRKADQLRYLAERQRQVYTELTEYLRSERGVKCPILSGAAPVASPFIEEAIEHWSGAASVVATAGSLPPLLKDAPVGTLAAGTIFQNRSALHNPLAAPLLEAIYPGRGSLNVELSWPMPNDCRGEAAALVAAYTSLHGGNGCVWQELETPGWAGQIGLTTIQSPSIFGAFPGYALMFRRGDLQPGRPVVEHGLTLDALCELGGHGVEVAAEQDAAKLVELLGYQRKTYAAGNYDPAFFLIGSVWRSFSAKTSSLTIAPEAAQLHDRTAGTIRSATGELLLDYRQGLLTINAPRAQAAVGFLKSAGAQELGDVVITSDNEYANILAISLDNQPLAKASRILIQVLTREHNLGWKADQVGRTALMVIRDLGEPPIMVESPRGSVLLRGRAATEWQAWALSPNGRRFAEATLSDTPAGMLLTLPQAAIYVELSKR